MSEVLNEKLINKFNVIKINYIKVDESLKLNKLFNINILIKTPYNIIFYIKPLLYIKI
jgi:hypothetical protein